MAPSSDAARAYSRAHGDRFLQELDELLRIPSLSGDPAHAADVQRAAEWLADHLRGIGAENVAVMPTAGHPVVYGEWLGAGPDKPTVLVYGHYDVVPGGDRRRLGHAAVRAGRQGRQDLRPRRDRRQGAAAHPRQGAGVVPEDRRWPAGQS